MAASIHSQERAQYDRQQNNQRRALSAVSHAIDAVRSGEAVLVAAADKELAEQRAAEEAALEAERARIQAENEAAADRLRNPAAHGIGYEDYIYMVAPEYAGTLIRIMYAESGGDPNAYNPASGCSGLLQFMPSTFAGVCGSRCDIWNPYHQIDAAVVMFDQGRQGEWVTY